MNSKTSSYKGTEFVGQWVKKKNPKSSLFQFRNKPTQTPVALCTATDGDKLYFDGIASYKGLGITGNFNNLEIISIGEAMLLKHEYDHAKKLWPTEQKIKNRMHFTADGRSKMKYSNSYYQNAVFTQRRLHKYLTPYKCGACKKIHIGHPLDFLVFKNKEYYIH